MVFGLFSKNKKPPGRACIQPQGKTIEVPKHQSLLQAALEADLELPHDCKVGTCVTCKCKLTKGEVKSIRDFSYVLSREELDQGYILACQAMVKPGMEIEIVIEQETDSPVFTKQPYQAEIVHIIDLTHDIKSLTLRLDRPIHYAAGQYASLSTDFLDQARDYSFATAPSADGLLEVTFYIRRVPGGLFTQWLFDKDRTGNQLKLEGPAGNFWLRKGSEPLLMVAGGSGLAPIMSLLQQMQAENLHRDILFLFGARAQRDLYCLEEIHGFAHALPGDFQFLPVLSEEPQDSPWAGARGLVTEHLTDTQVPNLKQRVAYLCGPPKMIDAAIEIIGANGIPGNRIHYDKFLDASSR